MSAIQFGCPFCGALAEVDADMAGLETACPACESVLVVPMPADAAPDRTTASARSNAATSPEKKPAPRPAKAKLWQTIARPGSGETTQAPPAATDQRPPQSEPVDLEEIYRDLSGGESAGPLAGRQAEARYVRSTREIARAEAVRRRAWVNGAMLVVSMTLLVAALAVLMYLTSK